MKTEKVIALLESAGKALEFGETSRECFAMAKALHEELALKNARKAGNADLCRAMKAVIKLAKGKPRLMGVIVKDGVQYACDSCMLIENSGDTIDLPAPELEPMDVREAMYSIYKKGHWALSLKGPTIAELKSGIALAKAKAKTDGIKKAMVLYNFAGNAPLVDAERLLIAVQAVGNDCTVWAEERLDRRGKPIGNLWFESADGSVKVLLLPIRPKDGEPEPEGFSYKKRL